MFEIGRSSTPADEALSRELRHGDGELLRRRRQISMLALAGAGSMAAVTLYQLGIVKHLPDPPGSVFDSDRVDAAGEAYAFLGAPDAPLALANFSGTLALSAIGGPDRHRTRPWASLATAGKIVVDAVGGVYLTLEQVSKHRALCSYCLVATAASVAMVPLAVREARAAWKAITALG